MKLINRERLPFVFIFFATIIVFSPIIFAHTYLKTNDLQTDFHQHMLWAMELKAHGMSALPTYVVGHSGWEILLVFINVVSGITFQKAGFVLALLCAQATAFALLAWFLPTFKRNLYPAWLGAGIVIGLMIAAPIILLWPLDGLMYLGYIGITSYHTPTMYLFKPFAVLQFVLACQCFTDAGKFGKREIMGMALVSLFGTFAKPILAICILPALACLSVLQRRNVNLYAVIFGLAIPSVLVLSWQFLLTYGNHTSSVEFSPFLVMSSYSKFLLIKFILSIFFPLMVLCMQFRRVIKDPAMLLAWLTFLVGAFFSYFLAEGGQRFGDGNFIWCGEISLFLLFCASTLFYLNIPAGRVKNIFHAGWMLHIICGAAYYFYCIFNNVYF